jgi:FkbM family methyltransferase
MTGPILDTGSWDPAISGVLRKALEPGMTFVDAGANIGYFSVLAAQLVGPEGRVFSVEPDPGNLRILRANLWRRGCANTTVLPIAAWPEATHLNLQSNPEDGAVTQVGGDEQTGGMVPAAPLDDLIPGPVHYLKVDTELTDHVVVKSAERLIRENSSMLVTVEFHPWEDSQTGHTPAQVLAIYENLGLNPYEIADARGNLLPTTYGWVAGNTDLPEDHNCFDFAMSRRMPKHMVALKRPKGWKERGGDMLEYLPAPIRPPIRDRDRKAREERDAARKS